MSSTTLSPAAVQSWLDSAPDGTTVVLPDGDGYDDARRIEAGGVDWRPAAIVRPRDATGVARAVRFARDSGLDVSVRAGGHSAMGLGREHGALTIDLRGLADVDLDVGTRTAWAGGGVTAGAYSTAAGQHGLATPFGDTAGVGIGGITLGGGVGLLVRKHGLTIDSLLGAEVVTADGEILQVDAEHHPDLFWGLRGGGGNLGVVTRFRFALHEVPSAVGGMLLAPATPESVAGLVAAAEAAPRELSAILMIMPCPPMPFVPAEWHGRLVVMANVCWSGAADAADAALSPLRHVAVAAGGLLADMVHPAGYADLLEGPHGGPAMVATGRTFFADGVDVAAATDALERLETSEARMRAVQLRVLGGAVADVPDDATAFAHRSAPVVGMVAAMAPTAAEAQAHTPWVLALADRLRGDRDGVYTNFVSDGDPSLARQAYPGPTWDRLTALKRTYDPDNLFRANLNVPPA